MLSLLTSTNPNPAMTQQGLPHHINLVNKYPSTWHLLPKLPSLAGTFNHNRIINVGKWINSSGFQLNPESCFHPSPEVSFELQWISWRSSLRHLQYMVSPIYLQQGWDFVELFLPFIIFFSDKIGEDPLVDSCFFWVCCSWNAYWPIIPCMAGEPYRHLDHHPPHRRPGLPHCDRLSSEELQHCPLPWSCQGWQWIFLWQTNIKRCCL